MGVDVAGRTTGFWRKESMVMLTPLLSVFSAPTVRFLFSAKEMKRSGKIEHGYIEPSIFVNGESLPLYIGKGVRAVVQVIQSDGADTTAKYTDEHQLIIKGLPVIAPLKLLK
ncbi:hypothetical protein POTOM_061680 [Populus tomentosa]|uniref:Uncharacterized protein n=1 Tax=Populus tomentosa TaxID=118781 RepID=A0A8X7XRJ2_POPTO|nr:hypothetical protein POTOM_061680 [Populus tomentosa]